MGLCRSFDAKRYNLLFPIVFWMPQKADYDDFIATYDPAEGFLIAKVPGRDREEYMLYHGNLQYKLKFFENKETHEPTGFSVSYLDPITQQSTLNIASLAVRITGLSKGYFTLIDDLHMVQYTKVLSDFPRVLETLDQLFALARPAEAPEVDPLWARLLEISEAKRNFDANFTIRWPYASFRRGDKVGDTHEYIFQISPPDEAIRENEERFAAFRRDNGLEEKDSQQDPSIATLRKRYISAFDAEVGNKKFIEIPTVGAANGKGRMLRGSIVRIQLPGVTHDQHGTPLKRPRNFYQDSEHFCCPWQLVIAVKDVSAVTVEDIPEKGGQIREQVSTDYDRYRAALQALMNPTTNQHWSVAEQVIVHKTVAPFARTKEPIFRSKRLNPQQKEAIRMAVNAPHFCLIQGPPGTGKTTIINEMLHNFILEGKKVLVCSKGNLAVDNVLEKWIEENTNTPGGHLCTRLGGNSKLLLMKEYAPGVITDRLQQKIFDRTRSQRDELRREISQQLELVSTHSVTVDQHMALCISLAKLTEVLRSLCEIYRLVIEKHPTRAGLLPQKLAHAQRAYDTLYVRMLLPAYEALCSDKTPMIAGFDARWQQVQADMDAALQAYTPGFLQLLMMLWRYLQWTWRENTLRQHRSTMDVSAIHSRFICGNPLCKLFGLQPPKLPKLATPQQIVDAAADYRQQLSSFARRETVRLEHIQTVQNRWLMELGSGVSEPMEKHIVLDSIPVIGSTCMGVAAKHDFTDIIYDVVIVDEAGQIPIFDLLVPLTRAKKVILIGDHLQLPPMDANDFARYFATREKTEKGADYDTVLQEVSRWFNTSLFEMLYEAKTLAHAREMLDTQFRMHPQISRFISQNFYHGQYKAGVTEQQRSLQILGLDKPIYFYDTRQLPPEQKYETKDSKGIYNQKEAELLSLLLVELILAIRAGRYTGPELVQRDTNGRITGYDIGVISGYQQQVDLITDLTRKRLRKALPDAPPQEISQLMSWVAINTLDSFQGRDNQIILFSLTRSNAAGTVGFLRDVRRLNVAMTRAKSLLVMVGDSQTLTATRARCAHDPTICVKSIFKNLLAHCISNKYYRPLKGGNSDGVE